MAALPLAGTTPSGAAVLIQCPGDADLDAIPDGAADPRNPKIGGTTYSFPGDARCIHLSSGDGFATMADGRPQYMFGFGDLTGIGQSQALDGGMLAAEWPAPTIAQDEGDEFYLTLTNVGMMMRPDLFDPHTVHYHGFPQASSIFDGMPDGSIAINMGGSLTYYYYVAQPGTYMYHCHVEATEHMQMGMLGNLYVRPAQNRLPAGTALSSHPLRRAHSNPDWSANRNEDDPLLGDKYVYNDGDGSTYYDVEAAIQIDHFDPDFHDASLNVQPLPFALMKDKYPMLNGRGYPDTTNPGSIFGAGQVENGGRDSQHVSSLIQARRGDRLLLRLSNLNVTRMDTVATTLPVPMTVVGISARLLRGPDGKDLSYRTSSVTLNSGETADVILYLDPAKVQPGRYFLYSTQLNLLSNNEEDFGGMMTEIRVN
ncbi:MAG: multicopper oxidase domain-containing protein [Deltaproteobacteria bacterium]|nr:multicopper oxidase domain-containing protein [Deltaproteobacteria bacterium]